MENETLAWIDLETTGLDEDRDAILEMALVITDTNLQELEARSWTMRPSRNVRIGDLSEAVVRMHQESGLWEESLLSTITLQDVAYEVRGILKQYPEKMIACGYGVGQFDRFFLKIQAPDINDALHYRNLDVRAFTAAMRMYRPDVLEKLPKAKRRHRALDDCRDAIAEFKYYREVLRL